MIVLRITGSPMGVPSINPFAYIYLQGKRFLIKSEAGLTRAGFRLLVPMMAGGSVKLYTRLSDKSCDYSFQVPGVNYMGKQGKLS